MFVQMLFIPARRRNMDVPLKSNEPTSPCMNKHVR